MISPILLVRVDRTLAGKLSTGRADLIMGSREVTLVAIKFATPVVSHYNVFCPYCENQNLLYGIPITMTTKCEYCKRKLTLVLPSHNMVKPGRERG